MEKIIHDGVWSVSLRENRYDQPLNHLAAMLIFIGC